MDLYVIPVSTSLTTRFEGHLLISTLRWLLRLRVGHGIIRLLLLWILRRWNIFGAPRRCIQCAELFHLQAHIISCCVMGSLISLRFDPVSFPALLTSGEFVIEAALTALSRADQSNFLTFVDFLSTTIRSCIERVF